MLERRGLIDLERSLRDTLVLSVYLDAPSPNPAERDVWRTRLDQELERVRKQITERPERRAFDRATGLLRDELESRSDAIGAAGWLGVVAPDDIRFRTPLAVSPPLSVHWGRGMFVTPALRALEAMRPAIVAIVDSRSAHLLRYRDGKIERLETLHAHALIDPVLHMGNPPSPGFHSATRGRTGTDAAERELGAAREHLMHAVASRMVELAGSDGWLLLGGTPEAAHEASAALPEHVASRTLLVPELHIRSSDSEIAQGAAHGASTLRRREDLAAIQRVIEQVDACGRARIRIDQVEHALELGAVQRLFISAARAEEQPGTVETLVREALDTDADVEVVSGDGAELLNAKAEGIAALLRFTPPAEARTTDERTRARRSARHLDGAPSDVGGA